MYNCYCKILKRLKELEKEVQKSDSGLASTVQNIRLDLDANTLFDRELLILIETIERNSTPNQITQNDINSLF